MMGNETTTRVSGSLIETVIEKYQDRIWDDIQSYWELKRDVWRRLDAGQPVTFLVEDGMLLLVDDDRSQTA